MAKQTPTLADLAEQASRLAEQLRALSVVSERAARTAQPTSSAKPRTRQIATTSARGAATKRTATKAASTKATAAPRSRPSKTTRHTARVPAQNTPLRGKHQNALIKQRRLRSDTGMSAGDIAHALKITAPEAHGLTRTMEAKGWIELIEGSRPKRWRTRK